MSNDQSHDRLAAISAAIQEASEASPNLSLVADGANTHRVSVRLLGKGTEEVRLVITVDGAQLTGRTGAEEAHAGETEIHDRLSVDLRDAFIWNGVECESAVELSALLVKHMRRRLKALTQIEPDQQD